MEKEFDAKKEDPFKYFLGLSLNEISKYITQGNRDVLQEYVNKLIYFLPEEVTSLSIPYYLGDEKLKVVATRQKEEEDIVQGEDWGLNDLFNYTLQKGINPENRD